MLRDPVWVHQQASSVPSLDPVLYGKYRVIFRLVPPGQGRFSSGSYLIQYRLHFSALRARARR